jgi:hypothetical protein
LFGYFSILQKEFGMKNLEKVLICSFLVFITCFQFYIYNMNNEDLYNNMFQFFWVSFLGFFLLTFALNKMMYFVDPQIEKGDGGATLDIGLKCSIYFTVVASSYILFMVPVEFLFEIIFQREIITNNIMPDGNIDEMPDPLAFLFFIICFGTFIYFLYKKNIFPKIKKMRDLINERVNYLYS